MIESMSSLSDVVSFSDKKISEITKLVEKFKNNDWVQYAILFKLMDFDLSSALMAVPFLKKDQHLNVPFIRKVRFNNLDGDKDQDHFLQLASLLPDFDLQWADVTEHIPLPDHSVDFFVINQGVIVSVLDKMICGLDKKNYYPVEVQRVMKKSGLAMAYDYSAVNLEPQETPFYIARAFGLRKISFQLPRSFIDLLSDKTGNKRATNFETFFTDPNGTPVTFFVR